MTKEMAIRAAQFDIFNDIEKQARNNGLQNFAYNLVKGSDYFYEKISNYKIEGATLSRPEQKEILFAKLLEEKGNTWYFTPRLKDKMGVKNPDGIFNGHLADMKIMESKSLHRLAQRIKDADEQNVYSVCLNLTVKPNYTKNEAINFIKNEVLTNKYKDVDTGLVIIKNIKEVCLSYENELIFIKNNNLK